MAYSDADLLNLFKGYSYGSSSAETSIQNLSSADQVRFAKLVETDWGVKPTDTDANAILSLYAKGIPFSSALINSVNRYKSGVTNNQNANSVVSNGTPTQDSAPLSSSSANSKTAVAIDNNGIPETIDTNEIVVVGARKSSAGIIQAASSASLTTNDAPPVPQARNDRRARLSPRAGIFDQLITTDGIMSPLRETYGLMFPITPTITENVDVNYESYDMAHGLMPIQAFRSGGAKTITLDAMFVAQTDVEAQYCLACIHFIRSFSKMNFGDNDPNAGTPPPILIFNAYGDAMFHNIPVVISSAGFTWPNDVDYIYTRAETGTKESFKKTTNEIVANGWIPSKFSVSITLTMQQTPKRLRKFNLEAFRNGTLLNGNGGWI